MRLSQSIVPVIGACLSLASCHRPFNGNRPPASVVPTEQTAAYDGVVSIDPAARRMRGAWTVRLAAVDSVAFLLNTGLSIDSVTGRDVLRSTTVTDRGLQKLVVHLAPHAPDAPAEVQVSYAGIFSDTDDGMNRLSPTWVELGIDGFWFPVVADLAHGVTGRVRVVLPDGYRIAASGDVARSGDTTSITNTRPLPDFALVASRELRTAGTGSARTHDVSASESVRQRIGASTAQCVSHLNARYGTRRPITTADVVLAPRTGPGYARQRYVVIPVGESSPAEATGTPDSRIRFICHEFAHFWSSGAAVAGPDNWLNEGFAEFVSGRAVRLLEGEVAWERVLASWRAGAAGQGAVWTPAATTRPGFAASYRKAPALLADLEERIGSARMDVVLTRFMTEPLRTTPRVLEMIDREAGIVHGTWFRQALGQ